MPRRIPEDRLRELLDAATAVFIAQGYRQTQMADVAAAMGVAKGTVYLYVESKEALFAACLRHADREAPAVSELDLPLAAPRPGELASELAENLARESSAPALIAALDGAPQEAVAAELERIVRELFAISARHRTVIELFDRCANALPELAAIFYGGGRFHQLDQLTRYFERRIECGAMPAVPAPALAARFVIEAIATWAVHMHWDPAPQSFDPTDAEETVVRFVLGGLLHDVTGAGSNRTRTEET